MSSPYHTSAVKSPVVREDDVDEAGPASMASSDVDFSESTKNQVESWIGETDPDNFEIPTERESNEDVDTGSEVCAAVVVDTGTIEDYPKAVYKYSCDLTDGPLNPSERPELQWLGKLTWDPENPCSRETKRLRDVFETAYLEPTSKNAGNNIPWEQSDAMIHRDFNKASKELRLWYETEVAKQGIESLQHATSRFYAEYPWARGRWENRYVDVPEWVNSHPNTNSKGEQHLDYYDYKNKLISCYGDEKLGGKPMVLSSAFVKRGARWNPDDTSKMLSPEVEFFVRVTSLPGESIISENQSKALTFAATLKERLEGLQNTLPFEPYTDAKSKDKSNWLQWSTGIYQSTHDTEGGKIARKLYEEDCGNSDYFGLRPVHCSLFNRIGDQVAASQYLDFQDYDHWVATTGGIGNDDPHAL
ncbi:uncharacterized protein IL334_002178 [Kwoniella shivajii]|uniref:Uncharacterized protein n=1 Tax=Kwoniella shivajii TaxID=564305 RepID=A0ABZ1CUA9_9TREE|nr:hypothetical protein IL334_002178 [Kwoniella shivajii]